MQLYALSQRTGETCDAAGKAMQDVFAVLKKKGFQTLFSVPKNLPKYMKVIDLFYLGGFLLVKAKKEDYFFFSIPENAIKIKLLKKFQKIKKYKIICFINDLNAFRYGNGQDAAVMEKMKAEAALIGMADYVLMPNVNTGELLERNGVAGEKIPVGIWDYLMNEKQKKALSTAASKKTKKSGEIQIAFAGNLNKSEFLDTIHFEKESGITLHLWGKLDEKRKEALKNTCCYHGVLKADEVPEAICTMDYGLVWDGNGKDEIEGGLGEYLRYNNSHKCGLYLASGIPAIVWEHAGMADFIKKHQCGITIERLSELPLKLKSADYETLRKNAEEVSKKLQDGFYFEHALDGILKKN